MSDADVTVVIANIRLVHQPIPEGTGGTGDGPWMSWNGPCRADLQIWPCDAEQAARMLERFLSNRRVAPAVSNARPSMTNAIAGFGEP